MKDPLLLLIVITIGLVIYFVMAKGLVYLFMIGIIISLTILWYFANFYISRKMVEKKVSSPFFYLKSQMVSSDEKNTDSGAFVLKEDYLFFYKRKGYFGGVEELFKTETKKIMNISFEEVVYNRNGVRITTKDKKEYKFISKKFLENKEEILHTLSWS